MKVPDWLLKFASRKLAVYIAGLIANHINAPKTEIEVAVTAVVDGLMTIAYLWAQGRIDHAAARSDYVDVPARGVDAVIDSAKRVRK
jgi:hypothetical protein